MPSKIKKLIAKALKARKEKFIDDQKEEFIEIDEEYYKLLKLTPTFNCILGFIKPFFLCILFK